MTKTETSLHGFVRDLDHAYERLHTQKEDAFWTAYMGNADDPDRARADLDAREIELNSFLRDPERLASVRAVLERSGKLDSAENLDRAHKLDSADKPGAPHKLDSAVKPDSGKNDLMALRGWQSTFAAHVIDSSDARSLADSIVEAEGALANERGKLQLTCLDESGTRVPASSIKLGTLLGTSPSEPVRRSAWEGLRAIEPHVLERGFLEVVRMRNRLGRMLGAEDYYDWKVRRVEGITKRDVFDRLDDLEARTRDAGRRSIEDLRTHRGDAAVRPWNLRYTVAGDVTKEQDPYFPFSEAIARWGRSFAALGIRYRNAELVLDLVDRKGKYENGFMHGPVPAWREDGRFKPARIQFTANAIPGMVGSGRRATETLFHEGGHAAHFANIDMPSPCFAQEFAPSSVAMAETQSMFLDSLLSDPDWQARYARTTAGTPMPVDLLLRGIRVSQPMAAWNLRAMCAVCYAERAIYQIPDDQLTAQRVIDEVREIEARLLFLDEGSPRPVLSVPHLLSGESSAYYHGYVLADMAVHQTRAFFLARDGHLVDNPRIGPDLRANYWQPGNSRTFFEFIQSLTGKPLTADAIAHDANRTVEQALAEARTSLDHEKSIPHPSGPVDLEARIRIVNGRETIAELGTNSFDTLSRTFGAWIEARSTPQPAN